MSAPDTFSPPICPHCGFDLKANAPVMLGEWQVMPDRAVFRGAEVDLSALESRMLFALAKAAPRFVKPEILGQRTSDCEDPAVLARVIISRIRRKLAMLAGVPDPIGTVRRKGYRWQGC